MAIRIRIKPGSFEALDETKATVRQVIGAAILEMAGDLRDEWPFKSGYSVNSWQEQADGHPALREGFEGSARGPDAATIFAGIGGTVSLVNTAVYANKLNEGHSPQMPAGTVEAIANLLDDYIDKHVMLANGQR